MTNDDSVPPIPQSRLAGKRKVVHYPEDKWPFRYGGAPSLNEPDVDPVYLSFRQVVGWIACRRITLLDDGAPATAQFLDRWHYKSFAGGPEIERRHTLVYGLRWVIARVRWWQRSKRLRRVPARGQLGRLDPMTRHNVRWIMRRHGGTAVAALSELHADVRQLLSAEAAHEAKIESARQELCAEIAAANIVAWGRPGRRHTRHFKSAVHEPIPAVFFANEHSTIRLDNWASCAVGVSADDWRNWSGPEWGDVKFKQSEVVSLWPPNEPHRTVAMPSRREVPTATGATTSPATMTVAEVLAHLSPEPDPNVIAGEALGLAGADDTRGTIRWGHWPLWPLILHLQCVHAITDDNVQLATRLASDIKAQGNRFGDIRMAVQALLDRTGRTVSDLMQSGLTLQEKWTRANDAWEWARSCLRDALRGDRLRASGRPCDWTGQPTRVAHVEISPLVWRGPVVPNDAGSIEREEGNSPSRAEAADSSWRFTDLQFSRAAIETLWPRMTVAPNEKIFVEDLVPWLTPMQAVAWITTRDAAVVFRASLDPDDNVRASAALGDTTDWCDDRPGLTTISIDLRATPPYNTELALRDLVHALRLGKVIASAERYDPDTKERDARQEMTAAEWAGLNLQDESAGGRRALGDAVMVGRVAVEVFANRWANIPPCQR
jgi:hypothetical protein